MDQDHLIDIKATLRSLVQSSPQKITIEELNQDYYDLFEENIPFKSFGYNSLEAFLRSLQDTLYIIGSGKRAQVSFIENAKSVHVYNLIKGQRPRPRMRRRVRKRNFSLPRRKNERFETNQIKQQINKECAGTRFPYEQSNLKKCATNGTPEMDYWSKTQSLGGERSNVIYKRNTELRQNYVKAFTSEKAPANSKTNGDGSKTEMNLSVAKKAFNTNENKTNINLNYGQSTCDINAKRDFVDVCLNKTELNLNATMSMLNLNVNQAKDTDAEKIFDVSSDDIDINSEDAIPAFAVSRAIYRLDFPTFAVPFGIKIPPYILEPEIQVNSRLQIFISEVHSPFRFWFQIRKDTHELDDLMYKIEIFYSHLIAEELCMPIQCITHGQVCCAKYGDLWHRGEILTEPTNGSAKVFFMDYGTVSDVDVKNIKYLKLSFARLPAQAIRGSLSHIKPSGLHWTTEATSYFLTLVTELMLYAHISEIDKEESVVYMVACESHNGVVQINTALIKNNYALYNNDWDDLKIEQNGGYHRHHPREDFPKFSMLESGDYPTLTDIFNLKERGINYESIYDKIIYNTEAILNKNPMAPECIRNLPFHLLSTNPFRYDIFVQLLNSNNTNDNKETNLKS